MDACDVLIVGGGPAGSACAWGLRKSGLNVAILDKKIFPRDKVCGGWITPGVLSALELGPAEYGRGRVMQPITRFRIGRIDGGAIETDYGRPVSYGIRRCEFDYFLLNRSGARLLLGTEAKSLKRVDEGWLVNDQIHARMLVGAGGHFCPVARLAGAKRGHEAAVVAQETEFQMDPDQLARCAVERETPELYFCADMKGYGWCFRKGNFLNIGLGRFDPNELPAHVQGFVQFLKSTGRISFDPPPMRGHAYLLEGTSSRNIADDGMLLIGDAAGLAHAQSGEGILPAIESGLLAAKTILEAQGSYAQHRLASYETQVRGRRRSLLASAGRFVPAPLIKLLAGGLLRNEWFVRGVVLDRWFLHA